MKKSSLALIIGGIAAVAGGVLLNRKSDGLDEEDFVELEETDSEEYEEQETVEVEVSKEKED